MPSIRYRQKIIARNFISSSGLYRDITIPWGDWLVASSAVQVSASVAASQVSPSGPLGLLFAGTSSGCFLNVTFVCPQDIAIAGPAGASGQLLADWASTSVNSAVATMSACVIFIPSGSEYVNTGASQRLGSGCISATGASLGQINSSSILNFNFPTNRTGVFMIRWARNGQDNADTCASSFMLFGVRVRYLADRFGS